MATLHATPFAGSWYPENRAELEALLERLCESSVQRTGPNLLARPLAFVVPHAGLIYSGTVAASAFRHLRAAKPQRVFLLGFAHRGGTSDVTIPDVAAFETPLGEIAVDQVEARALASEGPFSMIAESRVCDHSVEIQLPMMQKAAPHVPVVPLYVGSMSESRRRDAARILAQHLRPGDILMASSDLTHYGRAFSYLPFPANADAGEKLSELDSGIIDIAGSLDSSFFLDTLHQLHSTVCGGQPVALLLETLTSLGGDDVYQETLDYQTSADLTGDFQHSVSYASLGYFRADSFYADEAVQHSLLSSARTTLQHLSLTGERKPIPPAGSSPMLSRCAPVFVSLHEHGELFGCVGMRTRKLPLAEAVPEMALAAALDDPRFFRRSRVPEGLEVEISLLTPMKRIRDWKSFRIGQDGAFLEHGSHSGLLLPQVASRGEYTETRFLEALSKKAGLRSGDYRESNAQLSVFRAQVFGGPSLPKEPGFGTYAGQR